jgi:hypothetical protein
VPSVKVRAADGTVEVGFQVKKVIMISRRMLGRCYKELLERIEGNVPLVNGVRPRA